VTTVIAGELRRQFRGNAEALLHQQRFNREQREDRERKQQHEQSQDTTSDLLDLATVIVSADEIADFQITLTEYDAATVAALQANELAIDQVRERLDALLAQAHELPDGRRVFKTRDGLRVFDENGTELDVSVVDPELIADSRPRWEDYQPDWLRLQALEEERVDLLDYQHRLDDARLQLDDGDITREEFDKLRDDLVRDMPEAVRAQLPDAQADELDKARSVERDIELDIAGDMVPDSMTVPAAKPFVPGGG